MMTTIEKIVLIAITIAIVSVAGFYLMSTSLTMSKATSSSFYVRLVDSEFIKKCNTPITGSCYEITIRIVNTGEGGKSLYLSQDSLYLYKSLRIPPEWIQLFEPLNDAIKPQGFTTTFIADAKPDWRLCCCYEIPPHSTWEFTIFVDSNYVRGEKSLIISPLIDDPGLIDPCWDHDPCDPTGIVSKSVPIP